MAKNLFVFMIHGNTCYYKLNCLNGKQRDEGMLSPLLRYSKQLPPKHRDTCICIKYMSACVWIYMQAYVGFPDGSVVKICLPMQETEVLSPRWEDPLEKEMATYSSILAWESHEQRSMMGYSPLGCKRVKHDLVAKQQLTCYIVYVLYRCVCVCITYNSML